MRRTIVMTIAALVLLTLTSGVHAQDENWLRFPYTIAIAADGGIGMPLEPTAFSELWNSTLPFSFSLGYLIIPQVEVQGWFTYAKWGISSIPAQERIGIIGVYEVEGGGIATMMYGAAAKLYPLPNSRIMPTAVIGGGAYSASADDLVVGDDVLTNTMEDANGAMLLAGVGMEYGLNERWNVFAGFKYYRGFGDGFAPENLVLSPNEEPVEGKNFGFGLINLGILLKL
jgi:hypothetical protein